MKNHPFNKTLQLSKEERINLGIPPNKYYEEKYLLEMNPRTGKTNPENIEILQQKLNALNLFAKSPGELNNNWVERGPNNVGGRTRVVMFDPNDATNRRVFAGGVSGGLWVNEDITDANSYWKQVGISENLAITCMAVDPNDPQIMYIGTGEFYLLNHSIGNGIWKSTDGGKNWENIYKLRGTKSSTSSITRYPGTYYTTDIIVRDNDGDATTKDDSEVFISVGARNYFNYPKVAFLGVDEGETNHGVFKSTDGGVSFSRVSIINTEGKEEQPNDFELDSDNTLWIATTKNVYGHAGGSIYSSTDGTNFAKKHTVPNALRTEIAISKTDPDKIYVLSHLSIDNLVGLYLTTDGFDNITTLTLPNDADLGIPASDFARGQAFYNLMLEVDPTNDVIAYVGGIDLFRTTDSGTTWTQISKWSNNNNLRNLNVPLVHADQHGWAFHPTDPNIAVNGNDGGVYYASSLSSASNSITAISSRNLGYNVTQFYNGAIGQSISPEYLLAGSQDNGTQLIDATSSKINSSVRVTGGDGAYCAIDKDGDYMITSFQYGGMERINLPYNGSKARFTFQDFRTSFINPMDLDDNLNIVYSNGAGNSIYRFSGINTDIVVPDTIRQTNVIDGFFSNITALKVSPHTTNSTTLLVGNRKGELSLIKNTNTQTPSLTNISGSGFLGSISCIEFGADEDEILVTFHNFGVTSIWYTEDGGTTWLNKEGDLPDIPVKAVLMNPSFSNDEVILGTELGVWRTGNFNDVSPTWEQAQNGMSNVPVTSFSLRNSDNTVIASSYGRGMFTGKFTRKATTWTGITNTDWTTASNWDNGLPNSNIDAVISNTTNNPIINSEISVANLTIDSNASLTINSSASLSVKNNLTNNGTFIANSGASLIAEGTSTGNGNITYNFNIVDQNWHLISSPVVGEQYDDDWVEDNNIAISLKNNRGVSTYNNVTQNWDYLKEGVPFTFNSGIGYGVLRSTAGNISFTGSILSTDISVPITHGNNNYWNFMANPYPSYMNISDFITTNDAKIEDAYKAIYVWNGTNYLLFTSGHIHPGQSFFINSKVSSGNISFTKSMQTHQTNVPLYKQKHPELNLKISSGSVSKTTTILYTTKGTKSLDIGLDFGIFDGVDEPINVYSYLVENDEGVKIANQNLPIDDIDAISIPIGVKTKRHENVIFSLETSSLPENLNVYLEDRENNIKTILNKDSVSYTATIPSNLEKGRFFLSTSYKTLNANVLETSKLLIYSSNKKIHLKNLPQNKKLVTVFDITGKTVFKTNVKQTNEIIDVSHLKTGEVYILQLKTDKETISKKLIIY